MHVPIISASPVKGNVAHEKHVNSPKGELKDFGVSHPPGYPLFTTMAALMINLFPIGNTAWKLNLMSSLIGAGTNFLVYLNVKRLTKSDAGGVLASGWCGFSRIFWMWNIQGEVFSLVSNMAI